MQPARSLWWFASSASPDCEVTVRAVDREKQTPIKGARVVMHPYRAVTDENGIAKVRVARGQYDILVSGSRYMPACTSVEVTADMITSAELDADQPWTIGRGSRVIERRSADRHVDDWPPRWLASPRLPRLRR